MKMNFYIGLLFSIFVLNVPAFAQRGKPSRDSLKVAIEKASTDTAKIRLINELAYESTSDAPDEAIKYANQAMEMSKKLNYEVGLMNSHNVRGLAEYYMTNYDQALKDFHISKDIAIRMGDKLKSAAAINNIGLVYDDKADYQKALEYYMEALKLCEEIGAGNSSWMYGSTLNNVGLIYQNMGKYDQALDFFARSMKVKEKIGNVRGVGSSMHNIGLAYKLKGEYEKSLEYYLKALEIRKAMNDESGTALTLNNIGSLYETMQEYDKAYPYLREALDIKEKQKDKYSLSLSLFSVGANYCNRGKPQEGFVYLQRAMDIAQSIGTKDLIKRGYEDFAQYYSKMGNFQKAYEYQKLLTEIKDSILNSENSKQMNEMQTKYETEKKQKEIELLTKDSEIQALQLNRNKLWMFVLIAAVLLVLSLAALLYNRYKLKQRANDLLETQNTEITLQKKEITDSINYAKRIQESILPPAEHWNKILPQSFIFYRPKDIVSGDFYWVEQKQDIVCFAAVDCTGHGVPGALMSVVGFNLLTQAVNEVGLTKPSEILKHLDAGVTKTLRQSETGKGVKDGMDLSLCTLNTKTNELQYAGAFNSLYYISDGRLNEIKADKFPIGVNLDGKVDEYRNHTIQLKSGDSIYLFSDGYADQFGGERGKKFKYNQLKQMLAEISKAPIHQQKQVVEDTFDKWKGGLEQIDDVVIIGVRI